MASKNLTQNCGCAIKLDRMTGQTRQQQTYLIFQDLSLKTSLPQTLHNLGEGGVCSKSRTYNTYCDNCNAKCCL